MAKATLHLHPAGKANLATQTLARVTGSGQTAELMSPARHACDEEMDAATWCRHLVPDGSVYAFLADHRRQLFLPELFADVVRQGGGHPSVPVEVIATVMVLQALEGLSDREAISSCSGRMAIRVAWPDEWADPHPGSAGRVAAAR